MSWSSALVIRCKYTRSILNLGSWFQVIPTLIGSYQALFATMYLSDQHQHLKNKLFFINAAAPTLRAVEILPTDKAREHSYIDPFEFTTCTIPSEFEIQGLDSADSSLCLVDIREPYETQLSFIEAVNWPKSTAATWVDSLDPDMTYILVCQSGKRSLAMATELRKQGFEKIYSYFGGMNRAIKTENTALMEVAQL